ncbi:hypothetical protein TRAPUB_7416 [Trametes pubescens]|uniref:F-box domain-containing protein n=1 Tax=Trametes pubescens TaxID=154538 RepID=A0A1M2V3E1_TRAPU|nr:hypothetical protein TRAPUB_7416 [Trametes pubescens]
MDLPQLLVRPNIRKTYLFQSVTFDNIPEGVPWSAIMRCLKHPGVTSLSFGKRSTWTSALSPIPSNLSLHSHQLTRFAYTPSQWRKDEIVGKMTSLQAVYATESSYLRALVLPMSAIAESLTLPVETAPLLEMAATDWPRLRTLSLIGLYTHPDQCRAIPFLLPRMPNLRSLSIEAAQLPEMLRPHLLKEPSHAAEDELLQYLSQAFPLLQELELHRYKASPDESVPYLHIARTLSSMKYLRALYLNLDIRDGLHEPWDFSGATRQWENARDARGLELLGILQIGEYFEYVALFLRTIDACTWTLYRPVWSPGPQVDPHSLYKTYVSHPGLFWGACAR